MFTNPIAKFIEFVYKIVIGIFVHLQSVFLCGVRLYWGWQFYLTGKGKLKDIQPIVDYFTQLGIPYPKMNAYMAGVTEFTCGILLFVGLGSRLASIPLIVTMIVAYMTAHRDVVSQIVSNPDAFVTAAPFLFLLASLMILIFGPGKISLDALIKAVREKVLRKAQAEVIPPVTTQTPTQP